MTKILIADDDAAMRKVLKIRLEKWGFDVRVCADGSEALDLSSTWGPDLILSDVVMPNLSGLELLRRLNHRTDPIPLVLITAHGEVELAVEAMKEGAIDFITKPIDYDQLKSLLEDFEGRRETEARTRKLQSELESGGDFGSFVGRSPAMKEVYEMIQDAASTEAPVLITGESGTGKELAARALHELSLRSSGPFVPLNTAAIPSELMESELFGHEKGAFTGATSQRKGCFEMADGGTLFLDEIGEMPPSLQTKLLRVLEDGRVRRVGGKRERQYDVRIIAATNRDPHQAIEEGKLRSDLFFRLHVFSIDLPPLRDREGDLSRLVQHFIVRFNSKHDLEVEGVSKDAQEFLHAYRWPGNVREVRNAIERAAVLAKKGWIEPVHLPAYLKDPSRRQDTQVVIKPGTSLAEAEKQMILKTLEITDGNKAATARHLGIDVKTVRNKLKEYENS